MARRVRRPGWDTTTERYRPDRFPSRRHRQRTRPAFPHAFSRRTSRSRWRRSRTGLLISGSRCRTPTTRLGNGARRITCPPRLRTKGARQPIVSNTTSSSSSSSAPRRGTCRATWRAAVPRLPAVVRPARLRSRCTASTGPPGDACRCSRSVRRCHGREGDGGRDWAGGHVKGAPRQYKIL